MIVGSKCHVQDYVKVVNGVDMVEAGWIDMQGVSYLTVHYDMTGLTVGAPFDAYAYLFGNNSEDGDGIALDSGVVWRVETTGQKLYRVATPTGWSAGQWPRFVKIAGPNGSTLTGITGTYRVHIFGQ